jgi:hypothetical protein
MEVGMETYRLDRDPFADSNHQNGIRSAEEVSREILDYSFQKEAYKGHRTQGDYLIAYLVEKAHWEHYLKDGKLVVEKPKFENAYIGIAVHRVSDLRFIEKLTVTVTIVDEKGHEIGKQKHVYHNRPGLHHYGLNWRLPHSGLYTLRVRVDALDLKWRGNKEDDFTPGVVEVDFPNVLIRTGEQIS